MTGTRQQRRTARLVAAESLRTIAVDLAHKNATTDPNLADAYRELYATLSATVARLNAKLAASQPISPEPSPASAKPARAKKATAPDATAQAVAA